MMSVAAFTGSVLRRKFKLLSVEEFTAVQMRGGFLYTFLSQ
jgi:hypothetical protein